MARKDSPFIDPRQAARLLKTHVSTIYRLVLHGKIPARRIGGRRYVLRREDVVRYAEGEVVVPSVRLDWHAGDQTAAG